MRKMMLTWPGFSGPVTGLPSALRSRPWYPNTCGTLTVACARAVAGRSRVAATSALMSLPLVLDGVQAADVLVLGARLRDGPIHCGRRRLAEHANVHVAEAPLDVPPEGATRGECLEDETSLGQGRGGNAFAACLAPEGAIEVVPARLAWTSPACAGVARRCGVRQGGGGGSACPSPPRRRHPSLRTAHTRRRSRSQDKRRRVTLALVPPSESVVPTLCHSACILVKALGRESPVSASSRDVPALMVLALRGYAREVREQAPVDARELAADPDPPPLCRERADGHWRWT